MLIGHEEKKAMFERAVTAGAFGHAYLFFGDARIGKALFAEHLAFFLETAVFEKSETVLLDSMFFRPDEKGTLGVETVAEVKQFLWRAPFRSSRRLAVIDNAEALTPQAQAALLKIVEEPPPHASLIFIAQNPEAFFPPLLSRLSKVYFSRLPETVIKKALIDHFQIPAVRAEKFSKESFGSIGRAIRIAQGISEEKQDLGSEIDEEIMRLRSEDIHRHSSRIHWLLARESLIKRYNVNENLQRKAISQFLHYGK